MFHTSAMNDNAPWTITSNASVTAGRHKIDVAPGSDLGQSRAWASTKSPSTVYDQEEMPYSDAGRARLARHLGGMTDL